MCFFVCIMWNRRSYQNLIKEKKMSRAKRGHPPPFFASGGAKGMTKYMNNVGAIETLAKIKNKKLRTHFIKHMTRDELLAIKELVNALLQGRIQSPRHIRKLRKYAKPLRDISVGSPEKTKRTLKQHGGFLPLLAPLAAKMILPMIPNLVSSIFQ